MINIKTHNMFYKVDSNAFVCAEELVRIKCGSLYLGLTDKIDASIGDAQLMHPAIGAAKLRFLEVKFKDKVFLLERNKIVQYDTSSMYYDALTDKVNAWLDMNIK